MSKSNFSMYKNDEELADMEKTIETNSKKNLVIVPDGRHGLFKIMWDDGRGVIPVELSGKYTGQGVAEKDIKKYVAKHRTTRHLEKKERDEERDEKIRQGTNYGKSSEENRAEEKEEEQEADQTNEEKSKEEEKVVHSIGKTFLD